MVGKIIFKIMLTYALLLALVACGSVLPNQGTEAGTDTGEIEVGTVYNEQLVDFFLTSVADVYGMIDQANPAETVRKSSLDYKTDWTEKSGIGDAAITDVDGNGSEDLIVVRFDSDRSKDTILCIVEIYTCHGDQIEVLGGDLIRKELPLTRKESKESDITTVLSVFLNEENRLTVSWKYAQGKGTAPRQAFAQGGSVIYTFENETIIEGDNSNWIT